MLTGLLNPTSGEAEVFGLNIFEDINRVRDFLGVCPQHNILFDLLTPREHLEIFSDFKGNNDFLILLTHSKWGGRVRIYILIIFLFRGSESEISRRDRQHAQRSGPLGVSRHTRWLAIRWKQTQALCCDRLNR